MLTEREYLLLCELLNLKGFFEASYKDSTIFQLLSKYDEGHNNTIIREAWESLRLMKLQLKSQKQYELFCIYCLEDENHNTYFVFTDKKHIGRAFDAGYLAEVEAYIKQNQGVRKCTATGLGLGGMYAAHAAAQLTINGIVFGAPIMESLTGNIVNYIAENAPTGKCLDKVVFVKQKIVSEDTLKPYSQILMFDENGKAIVGRQTEFSKFCSWFYDMAERINKDLWEIFFKDADQADESAAGSLLSIYNSAESIKEEDIKKALINTTVYMENLLDKNIKTIPMEFAKYIGSSELDFADKLHCAAEKITCQAVKIVKDTYGSVETILAGIQLFTLGKAACDVEAAMKEFSKSVDDILEKEEGRIFTALMDNIL